MIDLHCHSTFSDGSLTPEELVEQAVAIGLSALALTDHDTMTGLPRFLAAGEGRGITLLPGVELSADTPGMHMLAYGMDAANAELIRRMEWIRDGRNMRNKDILERLNKLGFAMTWEEVLTEAGEGVVGRPHFAQVMLRKGYAKNKNEIFDRWLGDGKPGYAERPRLTAEDAIALIHQAGGVAVLAHPFTLHLGKEALDAQLGTLAAAGLDGMECYYSEHTVPQTADYLALAEKHGLLPTGGSDFHGEVAPGIQLGIGFGRLATPDDLLPPLLARIASRCT